MVVRALVHAAQRNLVCSVCYDLFHCPVALPCGHVFCNNCAGRCIEGRPQCPLCNHAVSRRSVSFPLPALVGLMDLVHDVVQSLNVRQGIAAATCGAATLEELEAVSAVSEAASSSSASFTGNNTTTEKCTPVISRDASASRTPQLLRSPPPSKLCVTSDDVVSDGAETQYMHPPLPLASSMQQCVAVRHCIGAPEEEIFEYRGCCVLCGLDISDRVQMRKYLRWLLDTDASCDYRRIRQLNEEGLSKCLGPMWDLHLSDCFTRLATDSRRGKRSCSEPHSLLPPLMVHQVCLEWCVLRSYISDGVSTMTVEISITLLKQISGEVISSLCSFCSRRNGVCLVLCGCCGSSAYHYPCALLTGSGVCDLMTGPGALLCADCIRRQR